MSIITKRILLCLIGIFAGITAWPVTEVLLYNQVNFSSYFIYSLIQGACFGFILGAFFGSTEGLLTKNRRSFISGLIMGAVIGAGGGAVGSIVGQKILFITGGNFFTSYSARESLALPISRAIGLGCMGIFVGITEGIRAKSVRKTIIGFIGGLLGGLLGGFIMEYLNVSFSSAVMARLLGLILLSLFIGLFYGLIEKQLSTGVLRVLNGDLKRREFLLNQKRLKIGSGNKCDIVIPNYNNLKELHATIVEEKGEIVIKSISPDTKLIVNDKSVDKQILKYEDVIKLGDVKMFYKHK